MKTQIQTQINSTLSFQPCKCPNQHLLDTGEICEICMGMVSRPDFLDEFPGIQAADPFDPLYFEELESYFDDMEYAA